MSSTEAELIGLSDMFDLLLVARRLLEFLLVKVTTPMEIFQDNTSTITISYLGRPSLHARRRFIDIRYFWFRQFLESKTVKLTFTRSEEMLADLLASNRSGGAFTILMEKLMGKR
mmetsp:Transcript_16161/g.23536  ORF Transcript_16161/g.23536 Transcript_16161/m.23536 type:complete len:115 (-) Transcript_16161:92-436(-)